MIVEKKMATIPHNLPTKNIIVKNNGFFPELSLSQFINMMRSDGNIDKEASQGQLQTAMIYVNSSLLKLKKNNPQAVHFDNIKCDYYGDESENFILYRTAVFYRAKADVIGKWRNFDTTKSGHNKADQMELKMCEFLAKSNEAISKLLGKSKIFIALI